MLQIVIPGNEFYDESKEVFMTTSDTVLQLEHSLLSLSKWESKWHKPFLSRDEKTLEETIDYIKCMTITKNVDPLVYSTITPEISAQINSYIEDPMTATWFNDEQNKSFSREVITSELIYYWMVSLQIPFECEKWHLNRLLTLVRVCNIKNAPSKKMSSSEIMKRNASLNASRRKMMNSRG